MTGNIRHPGQGHAGANAAVLVITGQHGVPPGLPDTPGKAHEVGIFRNGVHRPENLQLLAAHVEIEVRVEFLRKQRFQLTILEPGYAGIEDRAGAGVGQPFRQNRRAQRQTHEGTHLLEAGRVVEMQVEQSPGLQHQAVARRAVNGTGLQVYGTARGLNAFEQFQPALIHAANEQQIQRPFLQGQGIVRPRLHPAAMAEGHEGDVLGVIGVGGWVMRVVVHRHGSPEQPEIIWVEAGAALACLLQVDDDAAVRLQQPGVKAEMGAEHEIDGVVAQQVAGQRDLLAEAGELPVEILGRVQQGVAMEVARRIDQAEVDCRELLLCHVRAFPQVVLGGHCSREAGGVRCGKAPVLGRLSGSALHDLHRTVVVAVVAMRVMQAAVDDVVDVVAVGNGFVAAAGAVNVARLVAFAGLAGRAAVRIGFGHANDVLVDVIAMRVVQVTIVHIVDMAFVADGGMAAAGAVGVVVMLVVRQVAGAHGGTPHCLSECELLIISSQDLWCEVRVRTESVHNTL